MIRSGKSSAKEIAVLIWKYTRSTKKKMVLKTSLVIFKYSSDLHRFFSKWDSPYDKKTTKK